MRAYSGHRSRRFAFSSAGVVRPDDLVTAVVPLDSVADAFGQATSGQHIKVLLAVDDAAGQQQKG